MQGALIGGMLRGVVDAAAEGQLAIVPLWLCLMTKEGVILGGEGPASCAVIDASAGWGWNWK